MCQKWIKNKFGLSVSYCRFPSGLETALLHLPTCKFASIVNSLLVYRKSPTTAVPACCREDENKTQLHVLLVSLFSFGSFISFFFLLEYSFVFFASKEEFWLVWILDRHRVTYKDSKKDGHSRWRKTANFSPVKSSIKTTWKILSMFFNFPSHNSIWASSSPSCPPWSENRCSVVSLLLEVLYLEANLRLYLDCRSSSNTEHCPPVRK